MPICPSAGGHNPRQEVCKADSLDPAGSEVADYIIDAHDGLSPSESVEPFIAGRYGEIPADESEDVLADGLTSRLGALPDCRRARHRGRVSPGRSPYESLSVSQACTEPAIGGADSGPSRWTEFDEPGDAPVVNLQSSMPDRKWRSTQSPSCRACSRRSKRAWRTSSGRVAGSPAPRMPRSCRSRRSGG